MSDWGVLRLDQDPAPGHPEQIRKTSARFQHQAELLGRAKSKLSTIGSSTSELAMEGDYAAGFESALKELPDELGKSESAYQGCGSALSTFASSLEHAQSMAGSALSAGQRADTQYTGAVQQIHNLLPADRSLSIPYGLSDSRVDAATNGLDEGLRTQIRAAARRAVQAESDRDVARRLALQAAQVRGDAESKCAHDIGDSLHGIKNKSWWQKAWDATVHAVSWPFTSWDHFVKFCEGVALVVGVVALFVSGPIGWALAATAFAAGAVVAGDGAVKYAKGEIGFGEFALDMLGVLPVGGLLGKSGKALALLGKRLPATAKVFSATTRFTEAAGARVTGMFSRAWPKMSGALNDVRGQAVSLAKRTFGRDPIDLASGEVMLQQTDLLLPGLLELAISRTHLSSYRAGRWFGPTWASFLDQRLDLDGDRALHAVADGTLLCFPRIPAAGEVVRPLEGPRLDLRADDDGSYTVTDPATGITTWYASQAGITSGSEPQRLGLLDGEADAGPDDDTTLPLVAVTDRNGHRISLEYTPDGTLALLQHSGGYRVRVLTEDNRITGLRVLSPSSSNGTDTGIQAVSYRYDDAGRLAEVVNSSGLPLRFSYDSLGRLRHWEDRNGAWYEYFYDDQGRCTRTAGPDGYLSGELRYDDLVTVERNSLGQDTTYQLNDLRQIVAVTDPLGHVTRTEWDTFDHRLAITDALGGTTRFEYDEDYNVTAVHRPDGTSTTAEYNDLRLPTRLIMADGTVWLRQYDAAGNVVTATDPAGARTSFEYTSNGRLTAMTDPLGATTRFGTNGAGLLTKLTDPHGATTECERDAFGRAVSMQDAAGDVTRAQYSPEGWLTRCESPSGTVSEWRYDGEGNVVAEVDESGRVTRSQWTHFDLLAGRIMPDGAQLTYSYDTELRLVAIKDALDRSWTFEYDEAGHPIRETDVNGRTVAYRYDAAGRMIERINGAGESTRFSYDAMGRLVRKQSGALVTDYEFDLMGELVRSASPDAELVIERDSLGRILTESCAGLTSRFDYDAAGRRVGRVTPSGATSAWSYDRAGRVTGLSSAGRTVAFAHDVLGREVQRSMGAGATLEQTWGPGWQLLGQTVTSSGAGPAAGRGYGWDEQGRLLNVRDQSRGRTDYGLDVAGRVVSARTDSGAVSFAYDSAGSLASSSAAGHDGWELSGTLTKRAGAWRYEHDRQGRMTLRQHRTLSSKAQNWHYSWDAEDRLVAVTTPDGALWRYLYDGLGRRIAKQRVTADGTIAEETRFVWDGPVLAEQLSAGGSGAVSAISWDWHPDDVQPVAQSHRLLRDSAEGNGTEQHWYDEQFFSIVTDLIGTPSELVDDAGRVVWRNQATLWGARSARDPGQPDCPLAFPGQYRDDETGLHYNLLRYYDPASGSFVSPDPIGALAGPNPHYYVPNPTTHIDPLGLAPYPVGSAGASAGRTSGELVRVGDFASTKLAFEHYAKHAKGVVLKDLGKALPKKGGPDLPGFTSFSDYRNAARAFMGGGKPQGVLEGMRTNGDLLRLDPSSGLFGVRSSDGIIRTFFKPGPDMSPMDYFLKEVMK